MDALAPSLLLNHALRGGAIALLALLAALLLRHERRPAGLIGTALALGTAAFALNSAPGFALASPWLHAPIAALANGNAFIFWLFARALFDDDFRPRPWHGLAWLLLASAGAANCLLLFPAQMPFALSLQLLLQIISLLLALAAIAHILRGWRGDLVEKRRRLRLALAGSAAAYALVLALADLGQTPGAPPANESLANAACLAALALLALWALIEPRTERLFGELAAPEASTTPKDEANNPVDAHTEALAPEPALVAAIETQMREERLYRHEGFNLAMLAQRLRLPEHKLRKTINQGLGYRNFNAFANHYRLDEIKSALRDPGQAEVPILTIALDAGYMSLGPFNRAFKADTGLTPSEYRKRAAH